MDSVVISCEISCAKPGLHLCAAIGDMTLFNGDPSESGIYSITMPDNDGEHELVFTLSKKTPDHTQLNDAGEIINDTVVEIKNLSFDDIQLGQVLVENAVYEHDFNGTGDPIKDKFYGTMGCNGTVRLKFTTPVYLWLLEHM